MRLLVADQQAEIAVGHSEILFADIAGCEPSGLQGGINLGQQFTIEEPFERLQLDYYRIGNIGFNRHLRKHIHFAVFIVPGMQG